MQSNAQQCKAMQPHEFLLHLLLRCSLHYLRPKESLVASRGCSLLPFCSDFCYMFWDVFLERFWMHLCSFFCICSLVVLLLGFVFRDKFERFLKDLLDTCLKFLLHSVPDPPRQRKASVTHDPKRVMCYDQLLRACLQSLMKKLWRGFPVDLLKNA